MPEAEVDIRPVKDFATKAFRTDSLLRRVLAAEPDNLLTKEFVGKLGTWLAILREEAGP